LDHNGVIFLDELQELKRTVLEDVAPTIGRQVNICISRDKFSRNISRQLYAGSAP
jgi:predicted ATPase with chaperone activity